MNFLSGNKLTQSEKKNNNIRFEYLFPWICQYSLIAPNQPSNLNSKKEFSIQMHIHTHLEDCTAICILKTWVAHLYGYVFCAFYIIIIDYLKILQIKWLAYYKTMILGNILKYGALNPTIPLIKKKKKRYDMFDISILPIRLAPVFPHGFPNNWSALHFDFELAKGWYQQESREWVRGPVLATECLPARSLQTGIVPLLKTKSTIRQPLPTGNLPGLS